MSWAYGEMVLREPAHAREQEEPPAEEGAAFYEYARWRAEPPPAQSFRRGAGRARCSRFEGSAELVRQEEALLVICGDMAPTAL